MRPPLPPRPGALTAYPDWQPAPKHLPILPTPRLQIPRPVDTILLRHDHLVYSHNLRLCRVDVCTGEAVVVEGVDGMAEAVCFPNLVLWRGQWRAFDDCGDMVADGNINTAPPSHTAQWNEGTVMVEGRIHELSRMRIISCAVIVGNTLFVAFTDKTVNVYNTQAPDNRLKLLFWFETDDTVIMMAPSSTDNQLALLQSDGQVVLIDSALLEFNTLQQMHSNRRHYSRLSRHYVHAVTWNVNGQPPPASPAFWQSFLGGASASADQDQKAPSLVVVGLQEVVDLESKSEQFIKGNTERVYQWRTAIQKNLSPQYNVVNTVDMVGLALFVIVIQELVRYLSHESTNTIKCGLKGRHGNKGAVAWRAFLHDTAICIVNCHLAAGQDSVYDRNADAALIMKTLHFPAVWPVNRHHHLSHFTDIMDHHEVLWMGDLNYRIDMSDRQQVIQMVRQGDYQNLLQFDQLQHTANVLSQCLHEPAIHFPPTYKYDPMTNLFDTSPKQRTPAYCDRILHKPDANIVEYTSIMDGCLGSDHKPVVCVMDVEVWRVRWREWLAMRCDIMRRLLVDI